MHKLKDNRIFLSPSTDSTVERDDVKLPSVSAVVDGIQPNLSKQANHQHRQHLCQLADSFYSFQRRSMAQTEHSTGLYSALSPEYEKGNKVKESSR